MTLTVSSGSILEHPFLIDIFKELTQNEFS